MRPSLHFSFSFHSRFQFPTRLLSTLRPRLDFKDIAANTEEHRRNALRRNTPAADPVAVASLYAAYNEQRARLNSLRAERNALAKQQKPGGAPTAAQVESGKRLKARVAAQEEKVKVMHEELLAAGKMLPNRTHASVPDGAGGTVLRQCISRELPRYDFPVRDHLDIGGKLDLFDFAATASIAGSKFVTLRNAAVMLELALVQYTLRKLENYGFTLTAPPDLAQEAVVEGCGFQPRGASTQTYRVHSHAHEGGADLGLCLVGTSEIPLAGSMMDSILEETSLPARVAAVGHCFRAEAGSAGAATKGLYRLHQFTKVEMFVFCRQQDSEREMEKLCKIKEEICDDLGLYWRTLDMGAEELGASAYRKYDVEVYMPGRQEFGKQKGIEQRYYVVYEIFRRGC